MSRSVSSFLQTTPTRPPWRMSTSMYSPTLREDYMSSSMGSMEQLAILDEFDGLETPRQLMSNSSTIRCISRILPMPPAVISPLATVRIKRARTEAPSRIVEDSMNTSFLSSSMTQSVYAETAEEKRRTEERWARKDMDKHK